MKTSAIAGAWRVALAAWVLAAAASAGCSRPPDDPPAPDAASAVAAPPTHPDPAAVTPAAVTLCEHGVPAELCTRCNPDLAPVFQAQGDWCDQHAVPRSQCLQCDPQLRFTAPATPADWCREHAVEESKCTKCNPALIARFIEAGDYCREHGYPQSVCPYCHPERLRERGARLPEVPAPGTRVRLASAQTAGEAGIETRAAETRRLAPTIEVVGHLAFDRNRHAQLTVPGDAMILGVDVDVGDEVAQGQTVATLASSDVGADQARLAAARARIETARAALAREERLVERGVAPRKDVEAARAELASAQAEHDSARAALGAAGARAGGSQGRYALTAPFAGTVVARDAVAGRSATAGSVLLEIADLTTLWALLAVPEEHAGSVRPGQPVEIELERAPEAPLLGSIARVGASVDPASRTVVARVELPNPTRSLKAGAFVRARIQVGPERDALVVPPAAIQRAEHRDVAFVQVAESLYQPVAVEVGARGRDWVEVVAGLTPGAPVVTSGAFLLKTEISKEAIGAGCCEEGSGG